MGEKLAGVDAYIARAATFAQPILKHLRATVHNACPEVEEALKWGMPFFVYRGSPLCSMAAFKQHCSFGFWKAALVTGTKRGAREGMGDFGKITALAAQAHAGRLASQSHGVDGFRRDSRAP
jgi:hypothetical protein